MTIVLDHDIISALVLPTAYFDWKIPIGQLFMITACVYGCFSENEIKIETQNCVF